MKTLLALLVSALMLSGIATSTAHAGTGHINDDGFGSCDVTFTTGSATPMGGGFIGYRELTNFAVDYSSGKSCVYEDVWGGVTVRWRADGSAEALVDLEMDIGFFGSCIYAGTLAGVGTPGDFTLFPSPDSLTRVGGSFLCPSTLGVVNYFGDMTKLTY